MDNGHPNYKDRMDCFSNQSHAFKRNDETALGDV